MVKILLQLVFGGIVVEWLVSTLSIGKIGGTCCDIELLVEYWWNLLGIGETGGILVELGGILVELGGILVEFGEILVESWAYTRPKKKRRI